MVCEGSRIIDAELNEPILDTKQEIMDFVADGEELKVLVAGNKILNYSSKGQIIGEYVHKDQILMKILPFGHYCSIDQLIDNKGNSIDLKVNPSFKMSRGQ